MEWNIIEQTRFETGVTFAKNMKIDKNRFTVDVIRVMPENNTARECTFKPDSELHGKFKIQQGRLSLAELTPALYNAGWIFDGNNIKYYRSSTSDDPVKNRLPFEGKESLMVLARIANMHGEFSEKHTYQIHVDTLDRYNQPLHLDEFKSVYMSGTKLAPILRDICTDYTDCPENASEIAIRFDEMSMPVIDDTTPSP